MKLHLPTSLRGALFVCMGFACAAGVAQAATSYTAYMSTSNQTITLGDGTTYSIVRGLYAQDAGGNKKALTDLAEGDLIVFNGPTGASDIYMPLISAAVIVADVQIGAAADAAEDAVNTGLALTNGASSTYNTFTFRGDVSGKGDWTFSSSNGLKNQSYTFEGDVSGYTGTMDFKKPSGTQITFTNTTDDLREVNAAALKTSTSITFGVQTIPATEEGAAATQTTGGYAVSSDIETSTLNVNTNTTFSGNVTVSTVSVASGKTATGSFVGGGDLTKNTTGTMVMEGDSNIGTLTVNGGDVNVTAGATISAAQISGGNIRLQDGDHANLGEVTLTNGSFGTATNSASSRSVSGLKGTVTIKNGTTTKMILTSTGNGMSFLNVYMDKYRLAVGTKKSPFSGISSISGASISVVDDYRFECSDLTGATVSIATGKTLTNTDGTVTFGALTVDAGARLVEDDAALDHFVYTGSINLTLNASSFEPATTDASVPGLTSSVLPGTMDSGSQVTLSFADDVTLPYAGSSQFTLTFADLVQGSNTLGTEDFIVNGLEDGWVLSSVTAGDAGTMLTFTSNKVVPEPATATLSLLALAGLAARRRRK